MKKSAVLRTGIGLSGVALVTGVILRFGTESASVPGSPVESEKQIMVSAPLPPTDDPEMADTAFFIFENGDPNDLWQGQQFFGTMNKIGVPKSIMDALPGHQADFEWIRDRINDRVAYLQGKGHVFQDPNHKWQILVIKFGVVAGAKRIVADAALGKDIPLKGGIGSHGETCITEIWEIRDSQLPLLLERQQQDIPSGVHTQAEVNTHVVVPVSPPGTIGY